MDRSQRGQPSRTGSRPIARLAAWLAAVLLLALGTPSVHASMLLPAQASEPAARSDRAAVPTATVAQPAEQLVFSMGFLEAVDGDTVTVSFPDGPSEVYDLAPDTAIQTQNGDAQSVADLEVGSMVIVLSHEGDPTAITIVNGGDAGFHEAGPADIRGHENDTCPPCEASVGP